MSAGWAYFWPAVSAAFLIGIVSGSVAFWRVGARSRNLALAAGFAAAIAAAALWHGPLGAAGQFSRSVEAEARRLLVYYELPQVRAQLDRRPLSRTINLSGPADDFQRSELVRIMGELPGVSNARWSRQGRTVPLFAEAALLAAAGFALGLALAYLVALRRRAAAQWSW